MNRLKQNRYSNLSIIKLFVLVFLFSLFPLEVQAGGKQNSFLGQTSPGEFTRVSNGSEGIESKGWSGRPNATVTSSLTPENIVDIVSGVEESVTITPLLTQSNSDEENEGIFILIGIGLLILIVFTSSWMRFRSRPGS